LPDITVSAVHELRIRGVNHAGITNNVLYFGQTVDIFDDPDALNTFLLSLANAMLACVVDTLLPALPSDWSLEAIDVRQIQPTKSNYVVVTPETVQAGDLTESAPSQCTQVIIWRANFGRKRGTGRTSLPPPPNAGMSTSSLTVGQIALIAAFAACVLSKFKVGTGTFGNAVFGVYSRKDIEGGANFNTAFRPIMSGQVRTVSGSNDRRKPGRGA
jgi:hypothetical protein